MDTSGLGRAWWRQRRLLAVVVVVAALATACFADHDLVGDERADIVWAEEGTTSTGVPGVIWWAHGQAEPLWEHPLGDALGFHPMPGDWDGNGRWEPAVVVPPGIVSSSGAVIDHGPSSPADEPAWTCYPWPVPFAGNFDDDAPFELVWFGHGTAEWRISGHDPVRFGRPATDAERCRRGVDDVPVPADYDGDGVQDLAVYRPETGDWLVHGLVEPIANLGPAIGYPAPADYDGDGDDDPALVDPFSGTFTIAGLPSVPFSFDEAGHPAPADYDGDGDEDPALYLPDGPSNGALVLADGSSTDLPTGSVTITPAGHLFYFLHLSSAERCRRDPAGCAT